MVDPDGTQPTLVVIDFEATTPRGRRPAPIEVAAVATRLPSGDSRTDGLRQLARFEELIRPPEDARITRLDTEQTGIRPEDVADARAADAVLADLDTWLPAGPLLLVAHHASVEASLIDDHRGACPRLSTTHLIDTVKLAKVALPGLPSYSLDRLIHHLGIPCPPDRHRAMPDVQVTCRLFHALWCLGAAAGCWSTLDQARKRAGLVPKACRPLQDTLF